VLGVALALALVTLSGCSKSRGNVHGKVYYKGKPLSGCQIAFVANKKTVGTALTREDGSYEMKDVLTGEVVVTIAPPAVGPPKKDKSTPPPKLPPDLKDSEKSPEKYTVTTGDQEHDIRIE
jgi:hypothetical protein